MLAHSAVSCDLDQQKAMSRNQDVLRINIDCEVGQLCVSCLNPVLHCESSGCG